MSLGFCEVQPDIELELSRIEQFDREHGRRTYIFGATSNSGLSTDSSESITWPASREGVYGVCAADPFGNPDARAPFVDEGESHGAIYFFYGNPAQLFGLDGESKPKPKDKPTHDGAASWATPNLAGQVALLLQIVRTYGNDVIGRPKAAAVLTYVDTFGLDPVFAAKTKSFASHRSPSLRLTEVFRRRDGLDDVDSLIENLHDIYSPAGDTVN